MMDRFELLSQFDFHHRMEETSGTCLVFFTAAGCASCRAWRPILAGYRARNPHTQVFEVNAEQDLALVQEFGVFHLPAIYLYQNGQFHSEIQAPAALPAVTEAITRALAQPPAESP